MRDLQMSRMIFLVLFIALVVGGLWYLSTVPTEVPTRTIETDATPAQDAS
jgi:hypothetical protein